MPGSSDQRQHKLKTPFMRVPTVDWSAVVCGAKREFRAPYNAGSHNLHFARNPGFLPLLVVGYTLNRLGLRREELMILEDAWAEPLRALTPESLAAEGFDTLAEFKHYWRRRHPRYGWRGIDRALVIRCRPLAPGDIEQQKAALLQHLYGSWL